MNESMPLPNWAAILIGFVCVAIGALGKKFYGPSRGALLGDRVPNWFGRLGFISIGLVFAGYGIWEIYSR